MSKLVVNSYNEFAVFEDKELGASDWLLVDQDRVNLFVDATLDHQRIRADAGRAKKESLYQSIIAHGCLTLSLLPYLWSQITEVSSIKMLASYGMGKVRFGQAVVTGNRVYMMIKLHAISNLHDIYKTEIGFKIEVGGQRGPVLEGIAALLYYSRQRTMIRLVRR